MKKLIFAILVLVGIGCVKVNYLNDYSNMQTIQIDVPGKVAKSGQLVYIQKELEFKYCVNLKGHMRLHIWTKDIGGKETYIYRFWCDKYLPGMFETVKEPIEISRNGTIM